LCRKLSITSSHVNCKLSFGKQPRDLFLCREASSQPQCLLEYAAADEEFERGSRHEIDPSSRHCGEFGFQGEKRRKPDRLVELDQKVDIAFGICFASEYRPEKRQ